MGDDEWWVCVMEGREKGERRDLRVYEWVRED